MTWLLELVTFHTVSFPNIGAKYDVIRSSSIALIKKKKTYPELFLMFLFGIITRIAEVRKHILRETNGTSFSL